MIKFFIAWVVRKGFSLYTKETPLVLGWRDYLKNIAPIGMCVCVCVCEGLGLSIHQNHVFIGFSLFPVMVVLFAAS